MLNIYLVINTITINTIYYWIRSKRYKRAHFKHVLCNKPSNLELLKTLFGNNLKYVENMQKNQSPHVPFIQVQLLLIFFLICLCISLSLSFSSHRHTHTIILYTSWNFTPKYFSVYFLIGIFFYIIIVALSTRYNTLLDLTYHL